MMLLKKKPYEIRTKRTYLIRRLLQVAHMWLAITVVSFMATRCVPDSTIDRIIADVPIPEVDIKMKPILRHLLGLDQPIHIHYLRWMGFMKQEDGQYHGVLEGDLGHSVWE
jgi:ABC-type dipeptide/oligopeptide/nickel transport system permease component